MVKLKRKKGIKLDVNKKIFLLIFSIISLVYSCSTKKDLFLGSYKSSSYNFKNLKSKSLVGSDSSWVTVKVDYPNSKYSTKGSTHWIKFGCKSIRTTKDSFSFKISNTSLGDSQFEFSSLGFYSVDTAPISLVPNDSLLIHVKLKEDLQQFSNCDGGIIEKVLE